MRHNAARAEGVAGCELLLKTLQYPGASKLEIFFFTYKLGAGVLAVIKVTQTIYFLVQGAKWQLKLGVFFCFF